MSSPLPHGSQPGYHESSGLRSVRDSDANSRQWLKNQETSFQTWAIFKAISALSRQVDRLRRRVVGGGRSAGVSGGFNWAEYDPTQPYTKNYVVFFTPDGQSAGAYVAAQDVAAGIYPDTGLPNWVAWPNAPAGNWG